jgi:bacillithiol system protein YtxJ
MADWREIQFIGEWEQVLQESAKKPILVFKHSTRCPISARAWREYQAFVESTTHDEIDYVMVKVIQSRDVSNKIEQDLHVKHESPQAILVKNQTTKWHESHSKINQAALESAINNE